MKKQNSKNEFIKKDSTSSLNPFLIPISIILAGVLIMVSILISATAILEDKVVTKSNLKTSITEALKGVSLGNTANEVAPTEAPYDNTKVISVAKQIGIDEEKFTQCYNNQSTKDELQKDFNDAPTAGVRGTPGFIIGKFDKDGKITNGHRIKGAYPIESFRELIDAELNGTAAKYDEEIDPQDPTGDPQLTGSKFKFPKQDTSLDNDPVLGDKSKATIAIVEFSDYECPFCKRHFLQTFPDIKKEYIDTGKVVLVFRDYIAVPSHNPAATDTAIAAECVKLLSDDKKYYEFHDYMMGNTRANGQGLP
jgi:protein-disulfide isomerase